MATAIHSLTTTEPPTLPQNVEAEAALLGAMMIDNRIADETDRLTADHFFEPLHGRIFAAIKGLRERDMNATPVTLRPMFEADPAMKELGGPGYLARLTGSGAGMIGARQFAQQIYDLAMLRTLIEVGRGLVDKAMDTSKEVNPRGQIEAAEEELFKVAADGGSEAAVKTFGKAATQAVAMADRALNSGGKVSGITTGLTSMNAVMGGLQKSDLIILAGRPGMGKTALATNIAFNAAQRWMRDVEDEIAVQRRIGAKVGFFSLEMSADQLATRILAEQAGLSSHRLRLGDIKQHEMDKLVAASGELQDLPLLIDDTAGLTIGQLHTRVRRMQRRMNGELGLIVVDYLQLLQGSGRSSNDNRVQEISEISRGLKTLAKDLNVPVLALSQLSRAVEQREDKRPVLSDLRESGSIEQDADVVLFVYREDYYLAMSEPEHPTPTSAADVHTKHAVWSEKFAEHQGLAELIIAKQRHGSTGKVKLRFEAEITKFSNYELDRNYLAAP
ncbi:replicative DNA helicase [Sphingomonas bacterium]|uniref:replicative DNA helicase n=1 Tax=Sphingomonas bacterium TaxID=1895847 RepID=UPI00261D1808|nr:replicative DNA helicase [Sphingomonas bacterium]MDB5679448.1 replicative helicase [Sphingomonas bacterium]